MIKYFPINQQGQDFFVGDIHGYFNLLERKLEAVNFDPQTDRLFAIGDLVDRGPDSARVSEFLSHNWFHSIRGNHEQMLIDYTPRDRLTAISNGGQWFLDLCQKDKEYYQLLFSTLPMAFEVEILGGRIGMVHATVPYRDWDKFCKSVNNPRTQATALWSRTRFEFNDDRPVANIALVLVGHTPQKPSPRRLGNVMNLDGGVYKKTGSLTLLGSDLIALQLHARA